MKKCTGTIVEKIIDGAYEFTVTYDEDGDKHVILTDVKLKSKSEE